MQRFLAWAVATFFVLVAGLGLGYVMFVVWVDSMAKGFVG